MQEELECFTRNEVWSLVERPKDHRINVIGTKWVFKNKKDENGIVIRNKARKFEMSMMGELKFFLGFQVRQLAKGTFISQEKYVKDMLKKFDMTNANPMKTPMPVKGQLGSCDGRSSDDDRGVLAKRGRLAPRPPGCRTSGRVPPKAPPTTDTGSSARGRNKSAGNKRKDKHAAQDDDEIVPDNVGTRHIADWQSVRKENPYRFVQRTYTDGDRLFWTKTQASIWEDFYNTRECMKNGAIVMPKAINTEELALHEATKYRFVVDTLKGFMPSYNCWTKHGERGVMMENDDEEEEDDDMYPNYGDTATGHDEDEEAGGGDQDEEASDEPVDDDLRRAIADAHRDAETENEKRKLKGMLDDHKKKLYPNCEDGNTKLGATLELLQWKAEAGICDKPFEKLLKIMKRRFPKDNELPDSTYEAKKVLCPLGLEVLKIHACINDCILYRHEYENLEKCPVCNALRYKIRRDDPGDVEGEPPRKRVPAKVMWYAPIIPRLKRLFRNKEHARLLRWHKEDRKKDEKLRHPADGSQWRKIDREFPDFADDARNLRPEGSISKGYGTEEVIEFCVDFIPDLKSIGVPESRHEGRLSGKGTLGRKSMICRDGISFTQAHYTVLQSSTLVAPYITDHKNIVRSEYPGQSEDWITHKHMQTFGGWLRTHLMNNNAIDDQLYLLAGSPSSTILTFQGYEINGNTFYTFAQDKKSTNQNSGVRIDATNTNSGEKDTYYGYIEEIWELDYGPYFKIPLFRCKWFKLDGKGVKVDQLYGITTVDLNNLGYRDEPFVLANDVSQVFYVKDMSSRPKKRKHKETSSSDEPKRHIVLSGKRTIVGVEDKTDMSEDYNKFAEIPPFRVNIDPTIALNAEDTPWLRSKRS
ncbi:hypothetical protein QYE76_059251 [Lolium multiflorum]|uniref:Transposon protein, putative, CACTA, En/Spm sub-class n=1 Tax=Lolium multiflorum TaxID=4521 RepID=A0AAD8V6K6_LOLMU|nr:hypothetical protein QYE76_059251 [Lolium multiflorum]